MVEEKDRSIEKQRRKLKMDYISSFLLSIFLFPRISDFESWFIHALFTLIGALIFWFIIKNLFLLIPIKRMDREHRLLVCKQFGLLLAIAAVSIFSWFLYNYGRLESFGDLTGYITVFFILLIIFTVYYFNFKGYLRNLKSLRIEQ
jgi:hypothetical protein